MLTRAIATLVLVVGCSSSVGPAVTPMGGAGARAQTTKRGESCVVVSGDHCRFGRAVSHSFARRGG
ncbi:MAG TPA: hypothetical protein VIQ54_02660, partial [Polyangia bacterium]